MKPSKKRDTDSNKNRKQISENQTKNRNSDLNKNRKQGGEDQTEIKSYFKSAPKSFVVVDQPKKDDAQSSLKDFYKQILKEKLQELNGENLTQMDGACVLVEKQIEHVEKVPESENALEIENVPENGPINTNGNGLVDCELVECEKKRNECKEWEEKYKEMKKMYVKLTVHHADLDMKYKELLKTATGRSRENNNDDGAIANPTNGDIFTVNELRFLQSMPFEKKKDSTFVHQCIQFAYRGEPSVLVCKSLKGTKDWIEITETGEEVHHPAKEPLSPVKVNRIKEVFVERIAKCPINSVAYGERVKDPYINKLIASGIKNIAKKQH